MADVSTLISMVCEKKQGTPASKRIGDFCEKSDLPKSNRNPGGIGDPSEDFYNEEKLWKLAELNPNMTFYSNRLGRLVTGWEIRQSALWAAHKYPSVQDQTHQVRMKAEHITCEIAHTQALVRKALAQKRNTGASRVSARDACVLSSYSGEAGLIERAMYEGKRALRGQQKRAYKVRELLKR